MRLPARPAEAPAPRARGNEFLPAILQLQEDAPSPLPRAVLWTIVALAGAFALWASLGRLDVVAVAEGRLVPWSQLRIVQPAEGGVMRELLVKEGERVRAGQVLARRLVVAQRSRERLDAEQDLRAQEHRVEGARAAIEQGERRIAQIAAGYRTQLQAERADAETQLARLEQELEKLSHRQRLAELRAPADGVVKDLATQTPGAVLAPGTVLMTLVPDGEALVAEVWLANQDAGFVAGGQSAKLKLASFPFQRYGMLDATVARVSADSSERVDRAKAPGGMYAYRAQLEPLTQELRLGDARHALLPGMQLTAEIKLAERTVLEYLLLLVQKIASEAGRER
ncbi:MAG: HlyD family efflux transporter periplasmic adaptor subunit [Burkholderiales bacterium]